MKVEISDEMEKMMNAKIMIWNADGYAITREMFIEAAIRYVIMGGCDSIFSLAFQGIEGKNVKTLDEDI